MVYEVDRRYKPLDMGGTKLQNIGPLRAKTFQSAALH